MSGTANTANRASTAYNDENELLYDPFPSYAINRSCADLPWPEWNDAELNAEVWDEGKTQRSSPVGQKGGNGSRPLFDDPNPPNLPPVLVDFIHSWKRPSEVFVDENDGPEELTVFDPSNTEFELSIPSEVSPECEFFKVFIEEMKILQFYAVRHKFQVELESSTFVSTTQGEVWRPWHHIYSLCKAGKGQIHKPSYNPYGKYVVRLFYLGVWRKFVVDDKIPCDVEGVSLLPVTQTVGELWPIILTKAVLKILNLTPTSKFSETDFPFLSAFTGWVYGCFLSRNKSIDQIWDRLLCLIPRYEQPSIEPVIEDKPVAPPATYQRKQSARKESRKEAEVVEPKSEKFCFLMANLNFDDSLDLEIGLTMVRDCPLIKAVRREKTKPWKRIRWTQWAKEKGLWIDDSILPPYRRLQIITYNKKVRALLYPDPTLEPALYDVPMEDENERENNIEDVPEMWCDYLKFLDFVTRINAFLKPSCIVGNFKISCLPQKSSEGTPGGKSTPGGRRTAKNATPHQNIFSFPTGVKQSCNEPIFLLCESTVGIFLLISLWVYPIKSKRSIGYLDPDQPKLLKVCQASLIVELHDWRSYEQGELIGLIKTVGYSSLPLNLRAGRYVLKLWLCTESPYVISIYSSSNVYVNRGPRIRFLMSGESQRIINYINNVSNAFIALTLKFGKPDLSRALRDFYNIIKPGNDYAINYLGKLDVFIETFLNCILLSLRELTPNVEEFLSTVGALRSLFINPALPYGFPINILSGSSDKGNSLKLSSTVNAISAKEVNAAITIQRYFRGYRIRLLWKCQTPARKEFKLYSERLKKICDTIFVPQKRELEVGKLLRKIVMTKPELLPTFRFHEDFANVLQVEEFTGRMTNVEPFAWVPITRFVVGCHSDGLVPCYFYLSCNLERVVIQGFNNDTGEEIFRVTNAVSPHYYHSNVKGYTILAFGWNEANFKTVNWRLEMVKMKHFQVIHLCNLLMSSTCQPYGMPTLEIFEIRNFYVPNSKSRICRCLIKIQKQALLTLRLSLSYTEVHFELIISLEKESTESISSTSTENKVVWRVVSKNGVVIVPSLLLECGDNMWFGETTAPTVFSVEAFVLNNSWPLTKQEWGLVEPLRVNGEIGRESSTSLPSRRGRPESKRKLGRSSRKTLSEQKITDNNPLWLLQVLNDSSGPESGEPIVIEEDRSHAEAVKAMKASWREKDPGRRKRGRDIRVNFLQKILLENRRSKVYGEDEEENYEGEGEVEDPQWFIDRLSSFSYLLNDTSPTRYTYSPRILPDMPLMEMLCKYRREPEEHTLSANQMSAMKDARSEDDETDISFSIVRNMIDELEEDRKDFSTQCSHYRTVLMNHLMEEQKISNRLMEQAYEERLKALESFTR